jgi:hypothetical protein
MQAHFGPQKNIPEPSRGLVNKVVQHLRDEAFIEILEEAGFRLLRIPSPPIKIGGLSAAATPWLLAAPLIPQNLFNLPDLLLDLADRLLVGAFVFQIWILGSLSQLLLHLALHFVKLAFRLVFGT